MRRRPPRCRRWRATSRSTWPRSGIGRRHAPQPRLTVAYHSACSLQHGQRVHREPKELLAACGFVVKEVPEAHLCCGSAGTYNILQPEIAGRLRDRKVGEHRRRPAPDVIAAGNIGCIDADRIRHGDPGGASGRVDRLGDRRAGAGTIEGPRRRIITRKQSGERDGEEAKGEEEHGEAQEKAAPARRKKAKAREAKNARSAKKPPARPKAKAKPQRAGRPRRSCRRARPTAPRPMSPPGPAVTPIAPRPSPFPSSVPRRLPTPRRTARTATMP